ncbi:MAG TPA: peptidylprolyl isomerase [Acidimicrobiales bacterium]|nr:peptidylprolyl isomerase [Acidimicrobiales bacterium]
MPTEKRARKRSARDAKLAALQRQRRRRATVRRVITIAVAVGVVVLVYLALKGGKTTLTAQQTADNAAVAGGCASSPTTVLHKPSWTKPPAMTIDTAKTYKATVKTDAGTIVITLDAKQAPITVNNFVFLAQKKFYNCITFHRVIPTFMDQTGDPTGTGSGGPGYKFADELPAKASPQYPIGSVAMANSGPNTNGSQFFIVTGPEGETLAPSYSLFGHVTSGLSVAQKINKDGNANPSAGGVPPKVIHRMLSVTISSS